MAKAKRKAIKKDTLRELFLKSGNQCAFPGCTRIMINKEGVFVGQICHIEAAEEGGERFNENMTDDERAAFANLMLLCYDHHQVTNNVDLYPTPTMQAMKTNHEQKFFDPAQTLADADARMMTGDITITQTGHGHNAINAGPNSVITIIQGHAAPSVDRFADLDDVMGPLLDKLRVCLPEQPTWRDIVVIDGPGTSGNVTKAFCIRDEGYPDAHSWLKILQERGLVTDATKGGFTRVRMSHEFVQFLNRTTPSVLRLSPSAKRLLVHAAADDGMITLILSSLGLGVQAGALEKNIPHDQGRIQATWKAAGQELLDLGLATLHGYRDDMFELTKAGWEAETNLPPETKKAILSISDD